MKRVKVTKENDTGRNTNFIDNYTKENMTIKEFINKIENNENNYQDKYHIRNINGIKTPCSNPDGSINNNLD